MSGAREVKVIFSAGWLQETEDGEVVISDEWRVEDYNCDADDGVAVRNLHRAIRRGPRPPLCREAEDQYRVNVVEPPMSFDDPDDDIGGPWYAKALARTSRMSHASIVLTSVAVLDAELQRCLEAIMIPMSNNLRRDIFRGSLKSLSSKSDMCRALGVIDAKTHSELKKIHNIRNEFAHPVGSYSLDKPPIKKLFDGLSKPTTGATYCGDIFMECVMVINNDLERFLVRNGVTDNISPQNLPEQVPTADTLS